LLHDPSACRIPWRFTVLHTKDDLPGVLLWFDAETALVGEKRLVIEDGRRPTIPGLVVLAERIQKLCGAQVALACLPRDVSGGTQVLGKDNVIGTKLRLEAFRGSLAVALDIAVAAGHVGGARWSAERNRTEGIRKEHAVGHQRTDIWQAHDLRDRSIWMIEI